MKAYFKGFGMEGIKEITDPRPSWFVALPKDIKIVKEITFENTPDNSALMKAEFRYVGMIPCYELVDIK